MPIGQLVRACLFALAMAPLLSAAGGPWGAIGGMGDAMQRQLSQDADYEAQKKLMLQQHDQEMQQIRYQHELEMRRRQDAAADQRASAARDLQAVESAHPGWRPLVRSEKFGRWLNAQPTSIRQLSTSPAPADAILMLDIYKQNVPDWRAQN